MGVDRACKESRDFSELAFVGELGASDCLSQGLGLGLSVWGSLGLHGTSYTHSVTHLCLCLPFALVCSTGQKERRKHSALSAEGPCALAYIHLLRTREETERDKKSRDCEIVGLREEAGERAAISM